MTVADLPDFTEIWIQERPRLLGLAYTVVGSWADAEDVVSEAWIRYCRAFSAEEAPQNPPAWLTVVVSRCALDAATSATKYREEYVGQWLPDTLVGNAESISAEDQVVLGESVDRAFIRLLQVLRPVDRVILVLAEVLGMSHREIAEVIGSTVVGTRQRLHRARASLRTAGELSDGFSSAPVGVDRDTLDTLADALNDGDLGELVHRLSGGCVLWVDSGGLSSAARNPILGVERITRFLVGLIGKYGMPQMSIVDAVGGPALLAESSDLSRIITLEKRGGLITGIQIQQNPHKILGSEGSSQEG